MTILFFCRGGSIFLLKERKQCFPALMMLGDDKNVLSREIII